MKASTMLGSGQFAATLKQDERQIQIENGWEKISKQNSSL